ncbi:MAG: cytochrome b5-like heme/steroid binding domain-containing protein [bacterium]
MKRFFLTAVAVFFMLLPVYAITSEAATSYTAAEVAKHVSSNDCWMSFQGNVYDFTSYLRSHDRYYDIRPWCGKDMTEAFKTKDGMNIDHRTSSYAMLTSYQIGTLVTTPVNTEKSVATVTHAVSTTEAASESSTETDQYSVEIEGQAMKALSIQEIADLWDIDAENLLKEIVKAFQLKQSYSVTSILDELRVEYKFSPAQIKDIAEKMKIGDAANSNNLVSDNVGETSSSNKITIKNPYNFWVPFTATLIFYLGTYFLMKSPFGKKSFQRPKFNLLWNSALIISLIPSALFGFYLVFQYSIPALAKVPFDFLYWHVEGSLVFATLILLHLILRLNQYIAPVKLILRKRIEKK